MLKAVMWLMVIFLVFAIFAANQHPRNVTTIEKNVFAPIDRCECTTKWIKI